jgi:hypothetical protein
VVQSSSWFGLEYWPPALNNYINNYINVMLLSIIIFAKMLSLRALHDIAIVTLIQDCNI